MEGLFLAPPGALAELLSRRRELVLEGLTFRRSVSAVLLKQVVRLFETGIRSDVLGDGPRIDR